MLKVRSVGGELGRSDRDGERQLCDVRRVSDHLGHLFEDAVPQLPRDQPVVGGVDHPVGGTPSGFVARSLEHQVDVAGARRQHDLVLVTRNAADGEGTRVNLLNPFDAS